MFDFFSFCHIFNDPLYSRHRPQFGKSCCRRIYVLSKTKEISYSKCFFSERNDQQSLDETVAYHTSFFFLLQECNSDQLYTKI